MKNKILIGLLLLSLCSCVKVQKKSDLENSDLSNEEVEITKAPVIFSLDEVLSLKEDTEIIADEVRLGDQAKVFTNQFSLKIKSNRLIAEQGAVIQNFPDNSIAEIETPGLKGGTVQIKVNESIGNLQVYMNGQSGGPGLGGWTPVQPNNDNPYYTEMGLAGCTPNGGKAAGNSGSFFIESLNSENFFISASMKIASGGEVGPIFQSKSTLDFISMKDKFRYKNRSNDCSDHHPTQGAVGAPGQICYKLKANENPFCDRF